MKRFHVHVSVADLAAAIRFYSKLFDAEPVVSKSDYAKWLLEDPRVNFAISSRGRAIGVNHLGFQVESAAELTGLKDQLRAADAGLVEQSGAACCYARSNKYWVTDPAGVAWESFHTLGEIPVYGEEPAEMAGACCAPNVSQRESDAKGAGVAGASSAAAGS